MSHEVNLTKIRPLPTCVYSPVYKHYVAPGLPSLQTPPVFLSCCDIPHTHHQPDTSTGVQGRAGGQGSRCYICSVTIGVSTHKWRQVQLDSLCGRAKSCYPALCGIANSDCPALCRTVRVFSPAK